jgi:hypothetical protein
MEDLDAYLAVFSLTGGALNGQIHDIIHALSVMKISDTAVDILPLTRSSLGFKWEDWVGATNEALLIACSIIEHAQARLLCMNDVTALNIGRKAWRYDDSKSCVCVSLTLSPTFAEDGMYDEVEMIVKRFWEHLSSGTLHRFPVMLECTVGTWRWLWDNGMISNRVLAAEV